MKHITCALCLSALFSASVHADTLCQEEAKAVGYLGAIDALEPCSPQKNAALQADTDQVAQAREPQRAARQDTGTVEHYGQIQIQE